MANDSFSLEMDLVSSTKKSDGRGTTWCSDVS